MSDRVKTSITQKLLLSFIGIYVITYILTASIVFTTVRSEIINAETHTLSQLAQSKAERLEAVWAENAVNLRAWAALEVMNDLISGDVDKRVHLTLEGFKTQYDLPGEIYAFDASGKLIASSTEAELLGGGQAPALWRSSGNLLNFVDKHKDPFNGQQIVAQIYPVTASFTAEYNIGFLVLTYPWKDVERLIYGDNVKTVLMAANSGEDVLAADIPEVVNGGLASQSDSDPIVIINKISYVVGRSKIVNASIDWTVVTLRKTDVAVQSVHKVAWELAALGILLSLPIVMGVRWLAGRLTAPVVALTAFVIEIANSKALDKRIAISGHDEMSVLAQSFNFMAETLEIAAQERERFVSELEAMNQTLEAKVAQRTHELSSAFDDLKAAQSQLVHSEKMASLGQLVAGVAHELNNPIAFIYANFPHIDEYVRDLLTLVAELRKLCTTPETERRVAELVERADLDFVQEDIYKIIQSGQAGASRVKEIVRSLRSFSRAEEGEFKAVRLEDGIDDTLAILKHELRGRVTVECDYKLDRMVPCFSGQINQVFMNVIFNAIQAIKDKGVIRIATRREENFAVVTIADTGSGISPDVMNRIFDPFFTTKKVGEGTGLGLSISYGIIREHGGNISVQSILGVGTTFEIMLPLQPSKPDMEHGES